LSKQRNIKLIYQVRAMFCNCFVVPYLSSYVTTIQY